MNTTTSDSVPIVFNHVEDQWDDTVADRLDPVERLVYRSNLLGSDWRITNTGGGNTSAKLIEADRITGEDIEVLWVKGSGGDLRTAKKSNFALLYQGKVLALQEVYARFEHRGLRTFGGVRYKTPEENGRRRMLVEVLPWLRGRVSDRASMRHFVTATDMSCLMHLGGLARRAAAPVQVHHVAEILRGEMT